MNAEELRKELETVSAQIEELDKRKLALQRELSNLLSPVKVEDMISFRYGKITRRGIVLEIKPWCRDKWEYYVRSVKADGTEGAIIHVYSYHDPVKVEQENTCQEQK